MILADLLERLDSLDDNLTIYAERNPNWSATSVAVACLEPESGDLPEAASGICYLLEVFLAKEVLEDWRAGRGGRGATAQDKCEAVIYYAENDAYLPG